MFIVYLSVTGHMKRHESSSTEGIKCNIWTLNHLWKQEVLIEPHYHLHSHKNTNRKRKEQVSYENASWTRSERFFISFCPPSHPLRSLVDAEGNCSSSSARRVLCDLIHGETRQLASDFKHVELSAAEGMIQKAKCYNESLKDCDFQHFLRVLWRV